MYILLFVMSILMSLSILTYSRLESYLQEMTVGKASFQLVLNLERKYFNDAQTQAYKEKSIPRDEKTQKEKGERLNRKICFSSILYDEDRGGYQEQLQDLMVALMEKATEKHSFTTTLSKRVEMQSVYLFGWFKKPESVKRK